jgi:hypothetical protein
MPCSYKIMLAFTEYQVDQLVAATKVAGKVLGNTMKGESTSSTKEITIAVRRKDSPTIDLVLILNGRIKVKKLPGVASIHKPGVALMWHGRRIRGVDWKIRHEIIENGIATGFIKGWHEHIWTEQDEDRFIIPINPKMQNENLQAVLQWCVTKWNIEGINEQLALGGLWQI